MPHPLDNPIWSALTTRQAHLAIGDRCAKRFFSDISPFAAAPDGSSDSSVALAALMQPGGGFTAYFPRSQGPLEVAGH